MSVHSGSSNHPWKETSSRDQQASHDARNASFGDIDALDRLFETFASSGWGLAFAAADAVGPAADAVVEGIVTLLREAQRGVLIETASLLVLATTHRAALDSSDAYRLSLQAGRESSREPVSLLGETRDRQAALAFASLTEPQRCALWLIEVEHLEIASAAHILQVDTGELAVQIASAQDLFRQYYSQGVHRTFHGSDTPEGCDECGTSAVRLDDMESCVRAAIPPLPAWTRQQLTDKWEALGEIALLEVDREPKTDDRRHRRWIVGAVAAGGLLFGAGAVAIAAAPTEHAPIEETAMTVISSPTTRPPTTVTTPRLPAATDGTSTVSEAEETEPVATTVTTTTLPPRTTAPTPTTRVQAVKAAAPTPTPTTQAAPTSTTTTVTVKERRLIEVPPPEPKEPHGNEGEPS